jgi:hypothetical protein
MKFNLSEKQVAKAIHADPLCSMAITRDFMIPVAVRQAIPKQSYQQQDFYKHSPPDLQVLYQRFLI